VVDAIDIFDEYDLIALLVVEKLVDTILGQQHAETAWPQILRFSIH
jgi:hypothetical protein